MPKFTQFTVTVETEHLEKLMDFYRSEIQDARQGYNQNEMIVTALMALNQVFCITRTQTDTIE